MNYDSEISSAGKKISNCDNQILYINKAIDKYREALEILKPINVESCETLKKNISNKIADLEAKILRIEKTKVQLKNTLKRLKEQKQQEMNG